MYHRHYIGTESVRGSRLDRENADPGRKLHMDVTVYMFCTPNLGRTFGIPSTSFQL